MVINFMLSFSCSVCYELLKGEFPLGFSHFNPTKDFFLFFGEEVPLFKRVNILQTL